MRTEYLHHIIIYNELNNCVVGNALFMSDENEKSALSLRGWNAESTSNEVTIS